MAPPAPGPKSFTRMLVGVLSLVAAFVAIAAGFVWLVTGLQAGGYGTQAMATPFAFLGLGGGLLAFGIALLIWEMSERYGIRK